MAKKPAKVTDRLHGFRRGPGKCSECGESATVLYLVTRRNQRSDLCGSCAGPRHLTEAQNTVPRDWLDPPSSRSAPEPVCYKCGAASWNLYRDLKGRLSCKEHFEPSATEVTYPTLRSEARRGAVQNSDVIRGRHRLRTELSPRKTRIDPVVWRYNTPLGAVFVTDEDRCQFVGGLAGADLWEGEKYRQRGRQRISGKGHEDLGDICLAARLLYERESEILDATTAQKYLRSLESTVRLVSSAMREAKAALVAIKNAPALLRDSRPINNEKMLLSSIVKEFREMERRLNGLVERDHGLQLEGGRSPNGRRGRPPDPIGDYLVLALSATFKWITKGPNDPICWRLFCTVQSAAGHEPGISERAYKEKRIALEKKVTEAIKRHESPLAFLPMPRNWGRLVDAIRRQPRS